LTRKENDYKWELARETLVPKNLDWLAGLEVSRSIDLGDLTLHLHHGSPSDVNEYLYPDVDFQGHEFKDGLTLLGHTHIQMIKHQNSSVIINPGSTGQPRNGRPGADYAILDLMQGWVDFKHLDYDQKNSILKDKSQFSNLSAKLLERVDQNRFDKNPCGFGRILLAGS
jgi:predicted phosphodiesterase